MAQTVVPGLERRLKAHLLGEVEFDAFKVPINTYLPKPRPAGKLPVIVNVHGGPAGSSKLGWNAFARFFAAQGFAFVEPNIRGSTGFGRDYEMADNGPKRLDALGLAAHTRRASVARRRWRPGR